MKKITFPKIAKSVFLLFVFFAAFTPQAIAQYCTSNGNGTDGYNTGTRRVTFNTIDNASPNQDNAYSDYTSISTTVTTGNTYNLSARVNTDGNYTTGTRAWIDWNQDNDFLDAGEQYTLGAATNVANGFTSASPLAITIPLTATPGTTRMRVSTRYNFYPSSCAVGFDGEVEDYSIVVSTGVTAPEIDVTGLGNSITNNDTTPSTTDDTDFGTVFTSNTRTNTFTIENSGTANLGVSVVSISGTDASEFSVTVTPATTIINGSTSTFDITYSPSFIGTHNATVTINNTDSDENPYTFSIRGNGAAPAPEAYVSGNGNEIIDNDTSPSTADFTDFGGATIATPIVRSFTIENTGTLNLTLGTPVISGTGSANFALTTAPALSVAPTASTTFTITYTPTVLGTDTATVTFATNDSDENPYNFAIEGEGIDPTTTVAVYCEAFETAGHNWNSTTSTNGSWSKGTEATASAGASGEYVYTQRSSGQYSNNSQQVYTSPVVDLSGYEKLNFSIDVWYDMSNDSNPFSPTPDGFQIQFSDDGGSNWYALGGNGEGINWYNTAVVYNFGNTVAGNPVYINGWTGNTSGWVTASIDLHAQGFDNNSNVQFRVDFRSDNSTTDVGVAFDNVCISGSATAAIVDPTCGPAGIGSNLALWLRADAGTGVTDGSVVSTWEDQAFTTDYTNAEATSGTEPTYYNNVTNNVNFNPVVKFDGSSSTMSGKKGFYSDEFYIVVKPSGTISASSAPNDIYCGDDYSQVQPSEDVTGFEMGNTSARFANDVVAFNQGPQNNYGVANVSTTQTYAGANLFNGRTNSSNDGSELFCDGLDIGNVEVNAGSFTRIANSRYWLGRSERFGASYDGDIMEVISYRGRNSDADQQKIQSYLAIKYGIGLGINGIGLDYVDSDGNTIWDASADGGAFNYDVAGIGRDDCSSLNQKQSKSVNSSSLVTMGNTDIFPTNDTNPNNFANDKNYLLWAHDGGNLGASAPIVVDMSFGIAGLNSEVDFIAVQRSWKVQETGTVGTTKISLPEIALSATITPPGKFLMFISDTPTFNPTSEYSILEPNGANLETEYDFNGTKYITFGYAPEYYFERAITFDGVEDYLDVGDFLDITSDFTVSAWIKPDGGAQTILSKRDAAFTEGYDLKLNIDNTLEMTFKDGATVGSIRSNTAIPIEQWHQVAVTCHAGQANIYIDGVLDASSSVPNIGDTDYSFIIGAADSASPTDFFAGTIDEVRVWDGQLSETQIRYLMNQELRQHSDGTVTGSIIPQYISKNDAASISWSRLEGYFPMNRYTFTNVKDESGNGLVAAIKNLETVSLQTAPLPYVSASNGDWVLNSTWEYGNEFHNPGAISIVNPAITIDWNIVQTSHDVNTQSNNIVLGLEVLGNELSIENDSKIEVSHYLRLDGIMDLVGESQLVQTADSDLEPTSSGSLERDQAGTADTYTYNYWSSPVSTINNTVINQDFSIASLMRDGSDPDNPIPFSITGGLDGAPGTPIQLSAYWFYKYNNQPSSTYAAWQYVGPFGNMSPGEGWTMKGPGTGPITADQNYTFIGKPNNSTTAVDISLTVNGGNDYLVGNPFPSALDANDFIADNPHIDGTLLFWEHWGGGTHFLSQYQGGYAMYNLSGGTPAVSHPLVSQSGTGTKIPERYVPVGQGFFVVANTTGNIEFKNSQRNFVKEGGSSVFLIAENNGKAAQNNTTDVQPDDTVYDLEDTRTKFRFGFDAPSGLHRQLLLTLDQNTTYDYDGGYDGEVSDIQGDDMTWVVEDRNAIIQGAPNVLEQNIFPLYIQLDTSGDIEISLESEVFSNDPNLHILLWDQLQNTMVQLRDTTFTINLPAGTYADRFAVIFKYNGDESEDEDEDEDESEDDSDDEDESGDEDEQDDSEDDQDDQDDDDDDDDQDDSDDEDDQDDQDDSDDGDDSDDQDDSDDEDDQDDENDQDESPRDNNNSKERPSSKSANTNVTAQYIKTNRSITVVKENDTKLINAALYAMTGQLIKQWQVEQNSAQQMLPVSDISAGAYLLQLQTDHGPVTKKLLIH